MSSLFSDLSAELTKARDHFTLELSRLQVGRANPAIVESVLVEAYGSRQPLKNLANVGTLDAQTISIQAWDKSVLKDIERGITDAGIGLNPSNNGESILIRIPPMTEDRRKDMVKVASRLSEDAKVAIRSRRQDALKQLEKEEKDLSLGEDVVKKYKADIQLAIDAEIKKVDDMLKVKEGDIMKV